MKHCAFCDFATQDQGRFDTHVRKVHSWRKPHKPKPNKHWVAFSVLVSAGLGLISESPLVLDLRLGLGVGLLLSSALLWFVVLRTKTDGGDSDHSSRRVPYETLAFGGVFFGSCNAINLLPGPDDALMSSILAGAVTLAAAIVWKVPPALIARVRRGMPLDQSDAIWAAFAVLVAGWIAMTFAKASSQ